MYKVNTGNERPVGTSPTESSHWSSPGHVTRMRGSDWLMRWGQLTPAGFYPSLHWWYNCGQKMWAMPEVCQSYLHIATSPQHTSPIMRLNEVIKFICYIIQFTVLMASPGSMTDFYVWTDVGGTETEFILVNVSPWIPTTNNSRSQKLTLIQSIQIIKMKARGYFVGWNLSTIKSLV